MMTGRPICATKMRALDLGVDMALALFLPRLGFAPALVVRRMREVAVLAGVDYRDHELVGKRNGTVFEGRTVQQQHVASPPECRGELVHDAHLHTCRLLFGALARERGLLAVDVWGDA